MLEPGRSCSIYMISKSQPWKRTSRNISSTRFTLCPPPIILPSRTTCKWRWEGVHLRRDRCALYSSGLQRRRRLRRAATRTRLWPRRQWPDEVHFNRSRSLKELQGEWAEVLYDFVRCMFPGSIGDLALKIYLFLGTGRPEH